MRPRAWWDRLRDRFESLSPRDRRAIVIGAIVLAPVLVWSGAVRPYRGALEDLQDRLAAERALLEREHGVVREAPELPARIKAAQRELTRLEQRLVRADNPALAEAEISARLERLARTNRVLLQEVRSITGSPLASASDGIMPVYLNVSGESDFEGVLDFFHGMEQDQLLMKINDISVGPVSAAGESRGGEGAGGQTGVMRFTAIVVAFMVEPMDAGED